MIQTQHKRAVFSKDLDKMLSNDYVLVPLQATDEMLSKANEIFNCTTHGTDSKKLMQYLWDAMLTQAMNECSNLNK
ncbi:MULTISPECIES: hypothetical protein [unclassified Acinetobacter]|uniref:hypothetical protein n=1 Tax=unclassified Acinetobacter TaxID=196816 RepID=UPI0035BAF906